MNILKNHHNDDCLYLFSSDNTRHIIWEVESNCLLNCKYCYPSRTKQASLPLEKVDALIDSINQSEVECVHLTGGEPTQSPYLEHILKRLCNKRVYITTNLANSVELLEQLITEYHVYSVAVSLDSIRENVNNRIRGQTFNVINNLNRLLLYKSKYGIKTKIRIHCVISQVNLNDISELLQWAKANNIDEVSCQPVSIERDHRYYGMLHLKGADVHTIQAILQEEKSLFNSNYADSHSKLIKYYLDNQDCYIEGCHNLCSPFIDACGTIWNCPRKVNELNTISEDAKANGCIIIPQCMTCLKHLKVMDIPYDN